jgi:two-component system, NarL family, nitrate/nitrite response regulator NarL
MATLKDHGLQRQGDLRPPVTEAIRVLIIDDHVLVRAGLRILLESQRGITVVGEASHAAEAMTTITRERPDIILLDLDVATDLDLLPALHTITSGARVIVLTGMHDLESHRRAVRLGAIGLVRKEQASEVLLQAIVKVHAGEAWLDRALVASVLGEMTRTGAVQPADLEAVKIATLTPREREVITLVGQGLKNRAIAARLCIGEATVRHHLTSIFSKLGVVDRLALVIYAYRHGLSDFSQ